MGAFSAALAQLVRALVCGTRGPWFDPKRRYHLRDSLPSIQHGSSIDTAQPAFQSYGTHCAHILLRMDYALQPHLYKNVPVYLWPWVWWQLFQIERWIKETGRMVLGGVAHDGKVYVLHVADDPDDLKLWLPGTPTPTPWNRAPDNRQDLVRLVTGIAFDPTRFGDEFMLAMRLLGWPALVGCNEPRANGTTFTAASHQRQLLESGCPGTPVGTPVGQSKLKQLKTHSTGRLRALRPHVLQNERKTTSKIRKTLAPRVGLEPTTDRLTVDCSTN